MSKNSQASTSGYTRTAQTTRAARQPLPGRLSRLLSLPLELSYMYGKPEDLDVSSLGMSVGLTFNFTPLP